ncbi:hypothetical protein [Kordia sp.]|uniref:hypothetical protein n=1 Tax=Kordia sp. TaxID=1965332 RepID=UPI003D2BB865
MKFTEEIRRPFNILTLTLTVASLILSVFLFFKSQKIKSLSYQIDQTSSIIYDSENSSPKIKLFEKDSILLTENVYLLTGKLWNSGDIPVYKGDVRKDLELQIGSENRILDYKIIKQKDSSIANFSLTPKGINTLKVNWDYFDPNFSFNFQIIYTGSSNANFTILGKILDVSKVKYDDGRYKDYLFHHFIYYFAYSITFLVVLFIILLVIYNYSKHNKKKVKTLLNYIVNIMKFLTILYLIVFLSLKLL